jgi:hypothetical protein
MTRPVSLLRNACTLTLLAAVAGGAALTGCAMNPSGQSQILSRLPADQSDTANTAPSLTPEERARYDAIDRQVMFEQDQSIAAENAARAWSRYYSPPVRVFGSYSTGGWGTGIGFGFGPNWGW